MLLAADWTFLFLGWPDGEREHSQNVLGALMKDDWLKGVGIGDFLSGSCWLVRAGKRGPGVEMLYHSGEVELYLPRS